MAGGPQILAFSLVAAALVVAPGADMALIARQTLVGGQRAALFTTLGICAGCLVHAVASSLGLSLILARSALAFETVKLAGAGYLIYLGILAWRDAWRGRRAGAPAGPASLPSGFPGRARRAVAQGALTNLLNPKVALFYLTFLPQFIDARLPALPQLLLLTGIHTAMGLVWLTAYARCLDRLAALLGTRRIRRWFDGVTGALLMALGLRLALERR